MRACSRMSQERADLIRRFGRENVLELAGLLLDFRLAVHRQAVGEQALGQTVAANDAAGPLAAARSQFDDHACHRRPKRRWASAHHGRDSRMACDHGAPADAARKPPVPSESSFRSPCSPAARRGLPCAPLRRSRRAPPAPISSSSTSSSCSSSAMAKTSCDAILP